MFVVLFLDILLFYFNCYEQGEIFGFYVDNVICWVVGSKDWICIDVFCIIFLSEFEEYEGGDLVVEDIYGYYEVKLFVGDMILYLFISVYEVILVILGCCVVLFFWV